MRPRRAGRAGTMAVVVAVLMVAGLWAGLAGAVGAPSAGPSGAAASPSAALLPGTPVGIPGNNTTANASGPGTFYTSEPLPSAPFAQETCVYGSCYNVSNDVATTVTPSGLLVAAYTVLSEQSPCASLRATSVSNIAVVTSRSGGTTWTHLHYLGNPVCSQTGYPDAWEPAIASLANGTLVLAYVEYGLPYGELPPLTPATWPPTESRLVVTESYDNGTAWTVPQVLNISNPASAPPGLQFTPALPSVATVGQTIYITWMSLTTENSAGSVALIVSTDGGRVWSPTVPVASGFEAGYSMDPQAVVGPDGELVIAYTGNITSSTFFCGSDGCDGYYPPVFEGTVWVATSYSNGTEFSYSQVAPNVPLGSPGWAPAQNPTSYGPFETPAPQVAYAPATGQLFVAFTAGRIANESTFCFYGADGCLVDDLYFFNSSNGGTGWTPGNINTTVVNPNVIDPSTYNANATDSVPTVAIATRGHSVDLEAAVYNGTLCAGGVTCGLQTEVVFSTDDNGTMFTTPATIAADYTPEAYGWSGEYTSIAEVHSGPKFFWTLNSCPAYATTPCGAYPYSNLPVAQVEESAYFNGTANATLTFVASGVVTPANWTISILGNVRSGPANASLSWSGVPTGVPIFFSVPGINETDVRYYDFTSGITPGSPVTLLGNTTVTVAFTRYVPVTIAYTVPNADGVVCEYIYNDLAGCPTFWPGCLDEADGGNFIQTCFSYYFNPVPPSGQQWIPAGTRDSVGLTEIPNPYCYYYYGGIYGFTECYNFEFYLDPLGWAGSGPGSVSTSALNISFVPEGAVTETASFLLTGYCAYFYLYEVGFVDYEFFGCQNITAPLTIAENGLPSGTTWGVTVSGAAGSGTIASTAGTPIVNESADIGPASIVPWNVPSSTPGMVWVGVPSSPSPYLLPLSSTLYINYTLEPAADLEVPVHVVTLGLPAGLAGNATLVDQSDGATTAVSAGPAGANVTVAAGSYVVNASPVITTDGVAYYPAEVYSTVDLAGALNQSGRSPAALDLEGPATIVLAYGTEYWVNVAAGPGGTASPDSEWVPAGGTVTLAATADPGYSFLYWSGTGTGATAGPSANLARVAIQPGGPVTEVAVFGITPPPTWTVTVSPTGIPLGQEYSVTLGASTYSGTGSFPITNVSSGVYTVGIPDVAAAGTTLVRYQETSLAATAGLSGSSLTVDQDLILEPSFATDYLVSVAVSGAGTVSGVSLGPNWVPDNTTLSATATPGPGQTFLGWWVSVGDNPSTLAASSDDLQLVVATSANVVAQFGPAPPSSVLTYSLGVAESGLPAGTAWQFTLSPGAGASGTTSTLTSQGLNGTYALGIPVVYAGLGVRYVPNPGANQTLSVTSNTNATVTFTAQVLVNATVNVIGVRAVSGGGWAPVGAMYSLTAPAAPPGYVFLGWQGLGPGNYTGPNATANFAPTGPVTETATYGPVVAAAASPGTPWADYVAVGLIAAALLGVGVWQGLVAARRRPPAASAPRPSPAPTAGSGAGAPTGSSANPGTSSTVPWRES
jgi:Divergent InlB B-repeat domain